MSSSQVQPRQALVLVDPLNDFLHPDGKLYPAVKESLEATDAVVNIRRLVEGARSAGIPIYYGLHQQYREGNYQGWLHTRPSHSRTKERQVFAGWGGEVLEGLEPEITDNHDVVVSRHWNSSSFVNTDLDYQLRQRDISHLVMAGMVANTCLETTARDATERGYTVTLIKDGTAGFSTALKEAGEVVWPTLFEQVKTVEEWLADLGRATAKM